MRIPGFKQKFRLSKHPIPTVDFKGWLKSHQPTDRDEIGDLLFNHSFPGFQDSEEMPELDTIQAATLKVGREQGFETLDTTSKSNRRRYAGDWAGLQFLDRGRYSSVCMDEEGTDGNTLVNEFNAYLKPANNGFAMTGYAVADNKMVPTKLWVGLSDLDRLPSSGIALAREAGLIGPEVQALRYELGTTVGMREIDNIFDLRYPEAREWLVEFAKGDGDWLTFKGHPPPRDAGFFALFPTLMDTRTGGNDFTDQLANYLRYHGVQAMIYPSARSNVAVHWENGELLGFAGWSLVDWSDSEPPPKRSMTWFTDWAPPLVGGVTISKPGDDTPYRGSFRVEGNEEYHMFLHHVTMLMSIAEDQQDTGWIIGYRWHASRLLSDGPRLLTRCIDCDDEIDFGNQMFTVPNQCPNCGSNDCALPRPLAAWTVLPMAT